MTSFLRSTLHKDLKMCCGIFMNVDCGSTFNSICDTRSCSNYLFSTSWQVILYRRDNVIFTTVWPCIVTDSLWIKPTDARNSNFIGITTLHVSVSLSAHHQEFLVVHRLCTTKNSWWWAERLTETCRVVIPIKLEFSASVGFIHKDNMMFVVVLKYSCNPS